MGYKPRLMGPLFYIIEGLQTHNTVFIKNVTLANEMQPVPLNGTTEYAACTLSRATEQMEVSEVGREAQSKRKSAKQMEECKAGGGAMDLIDNGRGDRECQRSQRSSRAGEEAVEP